jgi:hypothetical protein
MPISEPSDYRLSAPFAVRMMGLVLAFAGLLVLVTAVLVALLEWPAAVLSVVLVAAVLGLLAAGLVLTRRATVVRLDETGYTVRLVRGAGVRAGRWKDVEDVVARTIEGARCVVLRRRDGSTTTIPVGILAAPADEFVRDLQQHLNRGHGYRPVA